MTAAAQLDLKDIWRQRRIPVIFIPPQGSLMVRLTLYWGREAYRWLRNGQRAKPSWDRLHRCWIIPRTWFQSTLDHLREESETYVVQPYRPQQKCAPACWNAVGDWCECSCMGANHGLGQPDGKWNVISEYCAIKYRDRDYAVRLYPRWSDEDE